jgi:hypothetical protein
MKSEITFLRRRHASLLRAVENLERNVDAYDHPECSTEEMEDIFDRINECLSEVRAIRVSISDKIAELENEDE